MPLLEQILGRIQDAATEGDLDAITRLNQQAKRVRDIEESRRALDAELERIDSEVRNGTRLTRGNGREPETVSHLPSGPVIVEIDFPRLGVNHPPASVSERQASDTLRRVMEVLLEAKGSAVLDELCRLRVNRGPLVSRNPSRDFSNPKGGVPYAHQRVGKSDYFVLTHSATPEKVRDLKKVGEALGFSSLHFRVKQVDLARDA